jgi:hypothetical protein
MRVSWHALSRIVGVWAVLLAGLGCQIGEDVPAAFRIDSTCGDSREYLKSSLPQIESETVAAFGLGRVGDELVEFGTVTWIDVDSAGRIFTLDALNHRVFVHTLAGEPISSFGGHGAGPGEIDRPVAVTHAAGAALRVADAGLWRVSDYSLEGSFLGSERLAPEQSFGQAPEMRFDASGRVYFLGYEGFQESLVEALGPGRNQGLVRGRNSIHVWDPEAPSWQSLVELDGLQVYVNLETGTIEDVPFAARAFWGLAGDELWYGDTDSYHITRKKGIDGESCAFEGQRDRIAVSETERARYYAAEDLAEDPRFRDRVQEFRTRRASIELPDHKPVVTGVMMSEDAGVWIRLQDTRVEGSHIQALWHVLSHEGELLGIAWLPEDLKLYAGVALDQGLYLIGARPSESGEPHVTVRQAEWSD